MFILEQLTPQPNLEIRISKLETVKPKIMLHSARDLKSWPIRKKYALDLHYMKW